ncbi:MAG TPA: DNA polymerase III subunit, partial [Pirellulales bacterium]|nr:DNA polymerase III subunit [Pirellulales bacterium]
MSWQGIEGHDEVVERFRRAIARNRLASTFLFVGPAGIGKRALAEKLAQALLCPHVDLQTLAPCGTCDSCVQVASRTHPDLMIIERPADRSFIPVAAFVGDEQRRMREGLCHDIALRPFMGGRKVAIIDDADYLNEEGANCLLKTLEEPPPRSVLILIGTSADRQLPTIRSRAQAVRFKPLAREAVVEILLARGLAADREQAVRLAAFSEGSVERAVELADEELWAFRGELLAALAERPFDSVALAGKLVPFVDSAGKEAKARRARA